MVGRSVVCSFSASVEVEFADEGGTFGDADDETLAGSVSSAGDCRGAEDFDEDPCAAEDSCVVVVGEVFSSLVCEVLAPVLVPAPILFSGLGGAGALTSFSITSASVFDCSVLPSGFPSGFPSGLLAIIEFKRRGCGSAAVPYRCGKVSS